MTSNEYIKVYNKFMKTNEVFYVSEHRKSYDNKTELNDIVKDKLDIILMPISVTRFAAVEAQKVLEKMGIKTGIIHLVNLKPFSLNKKLLNAIKLSKYGVLMTDNDYVDGILRILGHKINEKTNKPVSVLGLENKTAGHHKKVDNLPPDEKKIINRVLRIINKNK